MPFEIIHRTPAELEKYKDPERLKREAIPFVGQVKQQGQDREKIFLRHDATQSGSALYEFKAQDVLYAEEVKTITDEAGQGWRMVKIWVRKGAIALKLEPFTVADYSASFEDL